MRILDVSSQVKNFTPDLQEKFADIFETYETVGELQIPPTMEEWATKQFGSVSVLTQQRLFKITNKVLQRGVIYNEIRSLRPQTKSQPIDDALILEEATKPPFNDPENLTPADVFGRIQGKYCLTAANVAKYDKWHSVVIFQEPHPLKWSEEQIVDYIDVASQWFQKVHEHDKTALFPLFQWNCLWRAAASIVHGHMQLSVAQWQPYTEIEFMRTQTLAYQQETGRNYFQDYFELHQKLGLGFEVDNMQVIIPIDGKKEREVQLYIPDFNAKFASLFYRILKTYRDQLGIESFNVAGYLKPFTSKIEWGHMPILIRLIDRGSLQNKGSELGIMERFAQEVITNDPYLTIESLSSEFTQ